MERYDCKKVVGRGTYGSAVVATRRRWTRCVIRPTVEIFKQGEAKLVDKRLDYRYL